MRRDEYRGLPREACVANRDDQMGQAGAKAAAAAEQQAADDEVNRGTEGGMGWGIEWCERVHLPPIWPQVTG